MSWRIVTVIRNWVGRGAIAAVAFTFINLF